MRAWLLRLLGLRGKNPPEQRQVRLLSDEPIDGPAGDYFGFYKFAVALAEIVDHPETDTPMTIALSAPWGAGKTSVARMMEGMLMEAVELRGNERKRIVCRFNAWEHDDATHLGAALAADVARAVNRKRPLWRRMVEPLPWAMLGPQARWRRGLALGLVAALAAAICAVFVPTREFAEQLLGLKTKVVSGLGWLGILWIVGLVWPFLFSRAKDAAKFVDEPGSEAARGSMAQVKDQLGRLVRQATGESRIVIIVDDLERCRPERAVEVFEVSGQLLAHRSVITVLLADMNSLFAAAQSVYAGRVDPKEVDPELGRHYLEKLVQLQLELPPPRAADMSRLLEGLPAKDVELPPEPASSSLALDEVQSWSFYLAAFATAFSLAAISGVGGFGGLSGRLEIAAIATTVAAFLGAVLGTVAAIWRRRARVERRKIEVRLETQLEEEPDAKSSAEVVRDAGIDESFQDFAVKFVEGDRTVRSEAVTRVEAFIKRYPPRFPRGAKRMLNHARLLTRIARDREMFEGTPELTPEHLGKWIVLGERWPKVAQRIADSSPDLKTEIALRTEGLSALEGRGDSELERLLIDKPELHRVISRLVYFEPGERTAAAPPA